MSVTPSPIEALDFVVAELTAIAAATLTLTVLPSPSFVAASAGVLEVVLAPLAVAVLLPAFF